MLEPHWTSQTLLKVKDGDAWLQSLAPKKLLNGAVFEINEQQCLMLAFFFNNWAFSCAFVIFQKLLATRPTFNDWAEYTTCEGRV